MDLKSINEEFGEIKYSFERGEINKDMGKINTAIDKLSILKATSFEALCDNEEISNEEIQIVEKKINKLSERMNKSYRTL